MRLQVLANSEANAFEASKFGGSTHRSKFGKFGKYSKVYLFTAHQLEMSIRFKKSVLQIRTTMKEMFHECVFTSVQCYTVSLRGCIYNVLAAYLKRSDYG